MIETEVKTKRSIKAKSLIKDIKAGMTDSELMAKYFLSVRGLQSIFKKLEKSRAMTPSELYGRSANQADTADLEQSRMSFREYLDVILPIYDDGDTACKGVVKDLSETGVGVMGIKAELGEVRQFMIPADEFFPIQPFAFEAACVWVRREGGNRDYRCGFEITQITDESRGNLNSLLQALRLTSE